MIEEITHAFSFTFTLRALIVGILISLCAALLGVSLVLKRYSMIGDGLSHVGFGAMAIAAALNLAPLWVAIPVVMVAAVVLLNTSEKSKMSGDTGIALISSASLAIGIIVISLAGTNIDLQAYMFGSIVTLNNADAWTSVILCAVVICLFVLFYNRIFAITFDDTFAQATGTRTRVYTYVLAMLTAIMIVLGMRMMGALLISSLVIFPCVSSMYVCRTYRGVTILSAIMSVVSFVIGLLVSFVLETATGATVVIINVLVMGVCAFISAVRTGVIKH